LFGEDAFGIWLTVHLTKRQVVESRQFANTRAILLVASSADCGNALGLWAVEWSNWNRHRGVLLDGPRTEIIQARNLEVDASRLGGE
jgi:hypothetical protein